MGIIYFEKEAQRKCYVYSSGYWHVTHETDVGIVQHEGELTFWEHHLEIELIWSYDLLN